MTKEEHEQRKKDYWEWSKEVAKERAKGSERRVQNYYESVEKSGLDKDYVDKIDSWESWK